MSRRTRPNVLHISWHDTGRHFGCYGVPTVCSPRVDALAAEGVLFENAFAAATLCSPSRGAALTGRYPQANGLMHLCHGDFGWAFHPGEKHLSHRMKDLGYFTTLQGFQHEVHHANVGWLGFDLVRNADPAPPIYPIPPCDVVARDAAAFLRGEAARRQPFYMQLGFFETHRPYAFGGCRPDASRGVTVPPYLVDNAAAREDHAALQGAIRKADAQVGVVLDALRDAGLEEDTIVVFTVDHGLANPRAKATMYDPGLEIALVMRWPAGGLTGGRRVPRLVSNVDFVPTLYALLGETPPSNLQGRSFADARGDFPGAAARDAVFAMLYDGDLRAVRTRTHKLIRNFARGSSVKPPVDLAGGGHWILQRDGRVVPPAVELYDLAADPLETRNLAATDAPPPELAALDARLWRWMEEIGDPLLQGPIPSPRYRQCLDDYRAFREQAGCDERKTA